MEIIPVFYTFDKYYVVAAEVAIYSMLKHASAEYEYRLYVLHTDIPTNLQKELIKQVNKFRNASLEFINASAFDNEKEKLKSKAHFSKEIYYKLIAAEIFPQYDRIICSDVDVVFTGDISGSYFMHKDEFFYFAGVGQILESNRMKTYGDQFTDEELNVLKKEIAAGYLLINLKAIRERSMQKKLTEFYKENYHRLCLPEQDCIILCCWPDVKYLPMEYVVCNSYYKANLNQTTFYKDNDGFPKERKKALPLFTHALANPIQLHYVGEYKPWNSFSVPKQRIWFSTLHESGCTHRFLKVLPIFVLRRFKRYSLKRFGSKVYRRISNNKQ